MQNPAFLLCLVLALSACRPGGQHPPAATSSPVQPVAEGSPAGATTVDGISLPPGFRIQVFAEGVGAARHIVARRNGDVYVRLSSPAQGKCLVGLRDADGDGRAEQIQSFGDSDCGTGLALSESHLYYSSATEVWRLALDQNLISAAAPERIVTNLGQPGQHDARSLALDGKGMLYVNIGAPSNACQVKDRSAGSPGQDPCPLLQTHGGIWRFAANRRDQDKSRDGLRYATGIRNAVALDWNTGLDKLFLLMHGRDQLHEFYPALYDAARGAELPSEEFADIVQGDNLGWPYCYHDPALGLGLGPEYGGDGRQVGRCSQFKQPLLGFPGHYAPNDLLFYTGSQFPPAYSGGAFIAFHGSWNRGSRQAGYIVAFVPFSQGKPAAWQTFADGFAGGDLRSSGAAKFRPMGLAQAGDGSLLLVDSEKGRIWKISYVT